MLSRGGVPCIERTKCAGANLITRWDRQKAATVDNLVLLTFGEAGQHEDADLKALARSDPQFCAHVTNRLAKVRRDLSCALGTEG